MTTITLRDYLRKIENLLDENHLAEATHHCRYILKHYPRHLDTYRLLARALLEQRQYEDAGDLFRRILSADPNDLVAHVGLADVYKQESLLDQSLWHLERAFELDPYNPVIQDELRQLIARHYDLTVERIPLNQAALARIYLKDELYQQAVNELQKLLPQNGERVDLQVVLAEALWRDGQRLQAAELCQRILTQLPNCITANAILADVWLQTGRLGEAHLHLRRVQALMQAGSRQLDLETVTGHAFSQEGAPPLPDAVVIELLATAPESIAPATPPADWVSEVTFSDTDVAAEPEAAATENGNEYGWLTGLDEAVEKLAEDSEFEDVANLFGEDEPLATGEEAAAQSEPIATDEGIPSWLTEEADSSLSTAEEIPDWLSQSATESDLGGDETESEPADMPAGMPEWLADVSGVDDFEPMEVDPTFASEWLDELTDNQAEMAEAGETAAELEDEEDDWLATLARDTGELPESSTADDSTSAAAELEEWLAADSPDARYGDEVTDWLLGSESTENELEELMADIPADLPTDDSDKQDSTLPDVPEPEESASDDFDESLAWLDALTGSEVGPEPAIMEELAGEELPDWLAELSGPDEQPSVGQLSVSDDLVEAEATDSHYTDDDLPDWLRASALDEDLLGTEEVEGLSAGEDEPGYLDRIAAGEEEPVDELPTQVSMAASEPEAEDDLELSDWLTDLDGESVSEGDTGGLEWLDQLSAGAPVEQMPTLEWSDEVDEAEPTLDWLSEMAAPPDETLVKLGLVQEEETGQDEAVSEDTAVDVPEDLDDAMAWLEELAAQQGAPVEELPTVANVLENDGQPSVAQPELADAAQDEESRDVATEVTAGVESELSDEEVPEPFADVPEDLDEAMAWLEALAARQGAPAEELPGISSVQEEGGEPELDPGMAVGAEEELAVGEDEALPQAEKALAEAESDLDDAMAWLEELMQQEDETLETWPEVEQPPEVEPTAFATDEDETILELETGHSADAITAHDELAEALDWLEQVALEGTPSPEMENVSGVAVSDDELAEALDWLEQVATGEASPAGPASESSDVPDDSDAPWDWLEQVETEEEAEPEGYDWAKVEPEPTETSASAPQALVEDSQGAATEAAEPEIDFIGDMPDDPDEAMAWLERLAARQGAPLEELPSMAAGEDEEITPPAWLESEAAGEGEAFFDEVDVAAAEPEQLPGEADEPPDSVGTVVPEAEELSFEAASDLSKPAQEVATEDQVAAEEEERPDLLSGTGVSDWLAAEEEATVIRTETSTPATGPLVEAPLQPPADADHAPEPEPEEDSLILADSKPATSALALDETQLAQARQALADGNYEEAAHNYHSLVARGEGLNALISELETAVREHPQLSLLRRVLGDAYMRNGQLQKALETYRETLDQL